MLSKWMFLPSFPVRIQKGARRRIGVTLFRRQLRLMDKDVTSTGIFTSSCYRKCIRKSETEFSVGEMSGVQTARGRGGGMSWGENTGRKISGELADLQLANWKITKNIR